MARSEVLALSYKDTKNQKSAYADFFVIYITNSSSSIRGEGVAKMTTQLA